MMKPDRKTFTTKITAATTATQIFTSPWRARKYYVPVKMIINNENAANATIKFYDDDLLDATATPRGDSANAPLLEVSVPAKATGLSGTVYITEEQLPIEFYQGGMVGYSDVNNVVVTVEVKED